MVKHWKVKQVKSYQRKILDQCFERSVILRVGHTKRSDISKGQRQELEECMWATRDPPHYRREVLLGAEERS